MPALCLNIPTPLTFCAFSKLTPQSQASWKIVLPPPQSANFARQDARISWCRFTKRKFNLISDRDAYLEIANGQQIPYDFVFLLKKKKKLLVTALQQDKNFSFDHAHFGKN